MSSPPPLPPSTRADHSAYTRKTRAWEPDAPELEGKRIERARLTELERIPAEVRDIHRALGRMLPERTFAAGFLDEVRKILRGHIQLDVDLWLDSVRVLPRTQLRGLIPGATFIAVVGLEPRPEKVLLEIDLRFVYAVVDRLLGGRGAAVDVHRPLSDIEQGVFSFLLLKVLALFQGQMAHSDETALRLEDMRNDLKSCADILRREDHWMVTSWKMNVDLDVSFVRALAPVSLARHFGGPPAPEDAMITARHHERIRQNLHRLGGATFTGRVEAGRLEFSPEELEALDPGDIVVLEDSGLGFDEDGVPAGTATLRFGPGRRGTLHGVAGPVEGRRVFQIERYERITTPSTHDPREVHGVESNPEEVMAEYEHHPESEAFEEGDDGRPFRSEILDEDWGLDDEDASGGSGYEDYGSEDYEPVEEEGQNYEEAPAYADSGAEYVEEGPAEGYAEEGYEPAPEGDNLAEMEPLLGDMPVPVVVELGRVELTAEEVVCLRPGQLLDLGRSPTDPVDLVVNGRLLARGELVEIEGQLGVRIASLAKDPES
ncbi:MAG: type III secretion system cytoplasmic ring protein SctQ [Myxococcota bacterium]